MQEIDDQLFDKTNNIFELILRSKSIGLICHDNPDPDSIAPAFALQQYLKSVNKLVHIYYGGLISHPQNRSFVNVLGIDMIHHNEIIGDYINTIKESHDCIIFVD